MSDNPTHAASVPPGAELNRLIFRKLMPLLIAAYIIAFIDRTNIGLAKHPPGNRSGNLRSGVRFGRGIVLPRLLTVREVPSNLLTSSRP